MNLDTNDSCPYRPQAILPFAIDGRKTQPTRAKEQRTRIKSMAEDDLREQKDQKDPMYDMTLQVNLILCIAVQSY